MNIWAMTDDQLRARTEALDAELGALDTQVRVRTARATRLNRCAFCKRQDLPMDAGFCAPCAENLNIHE